MHCLSLYELPSLCPSPCKVLEGTEGLWRRSHTGGQTNAKETIPVQVSITPIEQRVPATPRKRHLPRAEHGDSPMSSAKHAAPKYSCIYLAQEMKRELFGEYSCLVLNRVL